MELECRMFHRVASRPFRTWQPLINGVTVWTAGGITALVPVEQEWKSQPCRSDLFSSTHQASVMQRISCKRPWLRSWRVVLDAGFFLLLLLLQEPPEWKGRKHQPGDERVDCSVCLIWVGSFEGFEVWLNVWSKEAGDDAHNLLLPGLKIILLRGEKKEGGGGGGIFDWKKCTYGGGIKSYL